jgi:hypothetical protein
MTTFSDLVTRALHDDFSSTKFDAIARDAINDAIGEIYRTTNLGRGDYTPSGYTLPAGALGISIIDRGVRIRSVFIAGKTDPLPERPTDELAQLHQQDNPTVGMPDRYAIVGTGATTEGYDLVFWPIADQDYVIDVTGRFAPSRMSADGGVVPLPDDYTQLPVYFARSEMFGFDDDPEMAAVWRAKYDDGVKRLREDLQRRSTRSRRLPSMWRGSCSPRFRIP